MSWKNYLFAARRLRQFGLLGMNQRNGDYISRYNPRHYYPLVDDKLQTKQMALDAGVAVPQLYAVVEIEHQIDRLAQILAGYDEFAVKPAHGSGGEGILIIKGRSKDLYRKLNGTLLSEAEIGHHISNILSGMYSLGGQPDKALIEYRVEFSSVFEHISYQGVPDIRTIVFRGVPVMSMLRLPTRLSDGKANLHQGAIGVGINLATGRTLKGVWREEIVSHHPDTGYEIEGLEIPDWGQIMSLAAGCQEMVSLGYIGVDIVLDAKLGPLMLEINARPGLSIQIANQKGLLPFLRQIETVRQLPDAVAERVKLGQQLHAG
ncbi:alpha-L-glutamate ligase-like protein [Methylomarinum vadi]|uniref:alpha-L-glutamate ligase-like protein n=1 Tax=Methylomarinum vadi TaxID=438855 RepID=UPI0004DFB4D9|nr:alpha-L-glutamate ligase-like protein [Methylomarinum vadi]